MSHGIWGERFYATKEPGWHQLGQVFKKALKPSVAVRKVRMDYTVGKYPLFAYPVKGHKVDSGRSTILRLPTADDPEWREFGTAGDKYELVQNADLADMLDPLAELWPLETMGAIHMGKTFFVTLKTGELDVRGDPVVGYFLVKDTKDGGTATTMAFTPVRTVCANTLVTALRSATVRISVQHLQGVNAQLAARVALIKQARAAIDSTTEVFRQLAAAKTTTKKFEEMLTQVYPDPKTPQDAELADYPQESLGDVLFRGVQDTMYTFNYYTKQAAANRDAAAESWTKLNDEYPSLAGTLWHAYNAVVECADYRAGGKEPEVSSLFGARAREKARAFALVTAALPQK